MALKEEMERQGNWLFRWRSYLPLLFLVMVLIVMKRNHDLGHGELGSRAWEFICLAVCLLGLGIRVFTIGYTPRGTSGRNTKTQIAETLNTSGMYSIVRHPLYVGNFLIWFGIALFPYSVWVALISIFIFWIYYERIMFAEEAYLRKKFNGVYEEWAAKTPAFIPRFRDWKKPTLSFSLKNALRREYSAFFAMIFTLFLLKTVDGFLNQNRLIFDKPWLMLSLFGFTVWLTLRTMKKKTRWLNVEGR